MTADDFNTLIDSLTNLQGQLVQLEAALNDKKQTQAAQAAAKAKAVTKTIEDLQSQALGQWTEDQDPAVAAISQMNGPLQGCIDAISQNIQLADNVTKAFATVNQMVTKAASFLKA